MSDGFSTNHCVGVTVYTAVNWTPTAAVRSEGQGPRGVGVTVYTAVTYTPTETVWVGGPGAHRCWGVCAHCCDLDSNRNSSGQRVTLVLECPCTPL